MKRLIEIDAEEAMRQAVMTAENYASNAARVAESYGIDPKNHPDAFARFVAGFSVAAAIDFHSSIIAMAADKIEDAASLATEGAASKGVADSPPRAGMDTRIKDLKLSKRASNCLRRAEIHTVRQLCEHDEDQLSSQRHLGRVTLDEIKQAIAKLGFSLKP